MTKNQYFNYGQKELEYLKNKDPKLAAVIDKIGHINRPVIPDLFTSLVNCIVGQQISAKALETIWKRFEQKFNPLTSQVINNAKIEDIQSCGISMRKAQYIKNLANDIITGKIDLTILNSMSDQQVCNYLSSIKGVGVWTAEMIMIFSMQRTNVLSYGDLAILRGLRMLYHHRKITPKLFAKYKKRYSPYASIASFYLWEIASGAIVEMKDYAPKNKNIK